MGSQKMQSSRDNKALMGELKSLLKHCDRRIGALAIVKCKKKTCRHCTKNKIMATEAVHFFQAHREGLLAPSLSNNYTDHYVRLQEIEQGQYATVESMPKYQAIGLGKCMEAGCHHYFYQMRTKCAITDGSMDNFL
eukprot:GHVU01050373.1.p1 GENE.GHVU01050373.1~~GHVU01050373.1.p1  ORF type:complete len:136 (-),score=17.62 GHVU01050373.1:744-1151(-)